MQPTIMVPPVDLSDLPGAPQFTPYKNSTKVSCERCNRLCWLGPTQKTMADTYHMPVVCTICLVRERGPGVLASIVPLTNKRPGE